MRKVALAGLRISRAHLREWKICEDICVAVERLIIDAFQVILGIEKEISEDYISKPLDRASKLFVTVIFFRETIEIGKDARICLRAVLPAFHHGFSQFAYGRGRLVGFAEGNVEGCDFRSILAQGVEHLREMCAREGPPAEDFLRALVNVHDNDPRVGALVAFRPDSKTQIEGVQ